jgi:hypothetical protein
VQHCLQLPVYTITKQRFSVIYLCHHLLPGRRQYLYKSQVLHIRAVSLLLRKVCSRWHGMASNLLLCCTCPIWPAGEPGGVDLNYIN